MATAHFFCGPKGGVGKTTCAVLFLDYLRQRGEEPVAVDIDGASRTLRQFRDIRVEAHTLFARAEIDLAKYKPIFSNLLQASAPSVIDTGGNAGFLSLLKFVREARLPALAKRYGQELLYHVPLKGGADLDATIVGLNEVLTMQSDIAVVAWLNEYDGPIAADGKGFEEMAIYRSNAHRLRGVVRLSARELRMDMELMQETFRGRRLLSDAIDDERTDILDRDGLERIRRDCFAAMESAGL